MLNHRRGRARFEIHRNAQTNKREAIVRPYAPEVPFQEEVKHEALKDFLEKEAKCKKKLSLRELLLKQRTV